jgi:hypothetical protein
LCAEPPLVDAVIANAENTDSPEFAAAYSALIDYLTANCGFAELDVQAQEYAFVGIPEEVPAGPTVVTFEDIGEEAHEFALFRINDDVTMTVEELLALPQEEAESMLTEVGGTFALPGQTGYTVIDLTPGRHVALCFVPQARRMEVIEQMMAAEAAAEGSAPEGSATIDSAHTDGFRWRRKSRAAFPPMAPRRPKGPFRRVRLRRRVRFLPARATPLHALE